MYCIIEIVDGDVIGCHHTDSHGKAVEYASKCAAESTGEEDLKYAPEFWRCNRVSQDDWAIEIVESRKLK